VQGKPKQLLDRGTGYLYSDDFMVSMDRIGGGHAEVLFESWANPYNQFAFGMKALDTGDNKTLDAMVFPGIDAGIAGVRFLENCVKSADNGSVWVDYT